MTLEGFGVYSAGLLTFATPCVLPLIPIYFSMLLGGALPQDAQGGGSRWRLFGHTLLFSLGFLVVFVALGLSATVVGHWLSSYRETLTLLGGLLIFLFGLKFIGVLRIGWLEREKRLDDRKLGLSAGWLNSLVMGLVFALGWTPCVGPILGAVLTYTAAQTSNPWTGGMYLFLYGAGFATPLLVVSLSASTLVPWMRKLMRWLPRIEKGTGALLAGVGLYVMLSVIHVPTPPVHATRSASTPNPLTRTLQRRRPPLNLGAPSQQPRLVEFVSSHCPICRQMIPTVAVIERECSVQQKLVEVIKVDVSRPENASWARRFRIQGVPTFVYLNPQGLEVARLVGYQRLASLRQGLAALTGQTCRGLGSMKQPPSPRLQAQTGPRLERDVPSSSRIQACGIPPSRSAASVPTAPKATPRPSPVRSKAAPARPSPREGQSCTLQKSTTGACQPNQPRHPKQTPLSN